MGRPFRSCDWIAADRIGDRLRLRGMTAAAAPLWTRNHPVVDPTLAALANRIGQAVAGNGELRDTEVVLSGARLPADMLRAVPAPPIETLHPVASPDGALRLRIVPGLKQAAPKGVTCGAETTIAGVLEQDPGFDGVICHLGTPSCWAQISAGEVVSFQSFLTAEIAEAMLAARGLRGAPVPGQDAPEFAAALDESLSRPERLAARLSELDADRQLAARTDDGLVAGLWGQLIGAELAAAKPYWLGQNVVVVGAAGAAALHAGGLRGLGVTVTTRDADAMVLAGLVRARGLPDG